MTGTESSGTVQWGDHEVVVDSVDEVTPVPIECPGCGQQFVEALSDKLTGTTCHGCNDEISYTRRSELRNRGRDSEHTTEQAKLIPDDGCNDRSRDPDTDRSVSEKTDEVDNK